MPTDVPGTDGTRDSQRSSAGERLNRFLSRGGFSSRREADRAIVAGRVTLNGKVVRELGTRVDLQRDSVKVDGKKVTIPAGLSYYLFFKPRGVVSTMEDPQGRPCLGDFLKNLRGRPVPVGRLDFDAEGLVLCTSDGDLINRMLHPRYGARRVYEVKINGIPERSALKRLEEGIFLDGSRTRPARVILTERGEKNSWLKMVLQEGRNRQVKRMVEHLGFRVLRLRRAAFGPLSIKGMRPGQFRRLEWEEIVELRTFAGQLDKQSKRL